VKNFTLILFLFNSFFTFSQIEIKTYFEANQNGFTIFADNNEYCPVSIAFEFTLLNLKPSEEKTIFVIPPKSKKVKITDLVVVKKNENTKMSYTTLYNYGDYSLTTYDKNFVYNLPFNKGKKFIVGQGYNGSFSHQSQNAIDFTMPLGTDIAAAREGIVVAVTQKNNKNCAEKSCAQFNNFVLVYHQDGTFAEYSHIKQNGSLVKKGDIVKEGQIIAKSGNVGWSNGPHLHFVVFIQRLKERETLKTKFKTSIGEVEQLIEKNEYQN
jgi:murein DD-endopeptidase MepM/ murein hydrolase activator NlpD